VATGDLNGDQILDLAVVVGSTNQVGILLGNGTGGVGDGTFAGVTPYPTDAAPWSLAVGDFNHDQILDLAVGCSSNSKVSVLLGQGSGNVGDGTFGARTDYATAAGPIGITAGDFNADQTLDLAVALNGSNAVSVLLGHETSGEADGTFPAHAEYPTGQSPWSLVHGDFNEDGILDLAVPSIADDSIGVLLGNQVGGAADGTFAAKADYGCGDESVAAAHADFDQDGIPDLAVVSMLDDTVSVLLGNGDAGVGDGTFAARVTYATGDRPIAVLAGDLDSDGLLDLVTANNHGDSLSLLPGNGDGTFDPARPLSASSYPNGLASGDFNGDGLTDLAIANQGSNDVSVLLRQNPCP